MRFWDSSAIVPLLVAERATTSLQQAYADDPELLVWWATEVECASAISRLEREGALLVAQVDEAFERLDELSSSWQEMEPTVVLRRTARRLVRVHPLSAADAFQLAAALVAAEGRPASLAFVTLDRRLAGAARREGLGVVVPASAAEQA